MTVYVYCLNPPAPPLILSNKCKKSPARGIIHCIAMRVYGVDISDRVGLTNIDLNKYAKILKIEDFRGVFMLDTLPKAPYSRECGIVNLNISSQIGSHWICYFKDLRMNQRIYFDSFGQIAPTEIQKYLKTKWEYINNVPVIQRNTDIVQWPNTHVCGHLCLFVLTSLTREHLSYQQILNDLSDGYTQHHW